MKKVTTTFDAIAGYEKEKSELKDLANVLKNYSTLKELGGRMPKGLLLLGKNGIGKSFFAQAFIAESELHCESVNISKRDEEFDSHIEEIFANAIKNKPSIIYIDELDKIAAKRDIFDFSDQNYNRFEKLLNCINDHNQEEGIFILATANTNMELDNSLIRSGRLDKIIKLDLPTCKEREAIFKFYAKDKKVDAKVDFAPLAKETDGFSGADIEAVMNEATIVACNSNRKVVKDKDIEKAISDKKFGSLAKDNDLDEESVKVIATHEAGHALMMLFGPEKSINRVTIVPRSGIRGYAESAKDDHRVDSLNNVVSYVKTCFGGMAAEEVFYKQRFVGSTSDLNKAALLVEDLVTTHAYYGLDYLTPTESRKDSPLPPQKVRISGAKQKRIEKVERKVFDKLYKETLNTINRHKKLAVTIINRLIEKKVVEKDELFDIYDNYLSTLSSKERNKIEKENKAAYSFTWNA